MKVLIVRNAFSYDFGGAERLAVHLAQELESNGIDAVVLSRQPRLLAYAQELGVSVHRAWWWSRQNWSGKRALGFPVYIVWQLFLFFWYVYMLVRLRPNVIHLMSKDDFIAGTFAATLFRKKIIWTDPADLKHIFLNNGVWYKNPVGKLVMLASRQANFITLVSESERRLVSESVGSKLPEKFTVVHTAGRDEQVKPRGRMAADKDAVIFCATSRLVVAKGILELVQAFNTLSSHTDKYRLWLVGNGPDEESFKAEAHTNPYIDFIGHSDKPLSYVAECDVFVHPTHHEGFSLSLAEAAMLGKPLIATNVGGNPELVNENNGVLVPVKDPAALYAAMERLGGDAALRKRLGAAARSDYVTEFDFSMVVKKEIIPLYE